MKNTQRLKKSKVRQAHLVEFPIFALHSACGKGDNISGSHNSYAEAKVLSRKIAFVVQYYTKKAVWRLKRRLPHFKRAHVNTFPAIHIKPMDWLDFAFKFSSELLVLLLAMTVAGFNLWFFTPSKSYADASLAAKFLSYHSQFNPQLYAKNTTVKTVVVRDSGFITRAYADSFEGLTSDGLPSAGAVDPEQQDQDLVISDSGMVKPNPDSVSGLITKQIKIYTTQPGDTLKSIAEANGISVQTIMWANKLTNQSIKPGWELVILPTDGVLYKANSNDTLPDIAKKYSGNLETIISYNGLENAEDIDAGQLVIIPGGRMPAPPTPKPTPKPNDGKVKGGGVVKPKLVDNGTGHIFPWGYCTWYVATRVHVPWGGNAKNWLANAAAYGSVVSSRPSVGAIVVTTDNKRYGHVALVEDLDDDGIIVSEMNYKKFGEVNQRKIPYGSKTIRGYILP